MKQKELEVKVPADLRKVLAGNKTAEVRWKGLTSIGRRDFISWIESARQPETRKRRVESVPSRLASGKRRPCCFAVIPMNLYTALGAIPKAKTTWQALTPNAKRDFIDWIYSVKESDMRAERINKACMTLASGKQRP